MESYGSTFLDKPSLQSTACKRGNEMSGKGAEKRSNATAVQAAKLKAQGLTTKEIAVHIGKKPEQIKALVLLGVRLKSLDALKGE